MVADRGRVVRASPRRLSVREIMGRFYVIHNRRLLHLLNSFRRKSSATKDKVVLRAGPAWYRLGRAAGVQRPVWPAFSHALERHANDAGWEEELGGGLVRLVSRDRTLNPLPREEMAGFITPEASARL